MSDAPASRALVIGAAGVIGRAVCHTLALRGWTVEAADRDECVAVVGTLPGSNHSGHQVDVTDLGSVSRLFDATWSSNLRGVVYAAGANYTGYLATTSWPDYERVMAVNVRGAFHVGSELARRLNAEPRTLGSVFLSSVAGLAGEAGGSVYCASKFALIGFVESIAAEIASNGGRANAVCPGNVDSEMLRHLVAQVADRQGRDADELLNEWVNSSAFRRLLSPDEVARACAWLLSEDASGISGQTIVVDGPPAGG